MCRLHYTAEAVQACQLQAHCWRVTRYCWVVVQACRVSGRHLLALMFAWPQPSALNWGQASPHVTVALPPYIMLLMGDSGWGPNHDTAAVLGWVAAEVAGAVAGAWATSLVPDTIMRPVSWPDEVDVGDASGSIRGILLAYNLRICHSCSSCSSGIPSMVGSLMTWKARLSAVIGAPHHTPGSSKGPRPGIKLLSAWTGKKSLNV